MIDLRRALLAGAPSLVGAVPAVAVLAGAAGRLPPRLATHFTATGAANGYASRPALVAVDLGVAVGCAVLLGLVAGRFGGIRPAGSRYDLGRLTIALAWCVAGLTGVFQFATVAVNLDRTTPASALPAAATALALAAAVAVGTVGWLVAPRAAAGTGRPEPAEPTRLATTEQVSWTRTISAPAVALAGMALVVAGLVVAGLIGPAAGIPTAVAGALVAAFARARVTVDRHGLTVALGLLGVPHVRIPVDDVASVAAADVSPLQFGGWGYRWVPGGSGFVLRAGPALVVTRRSGRRFTVTVDDAETGAALLAGVSGSPGC